MTLDEIFAEMEKDFAIDRLDLIEDICRSQMVWRKYMELYARSKLKVELLENKMKNLLAEKREYYSGDAPPEVYKNKPFGIKVKTEAEKKQYIENDSDVVKANEQILIERVKMELFYGCIEQHKTRGFAVKNIIAWAQYEAGGF
jgi:hypothetical protein